MVLLWDSMVSFGMNRLTENLSRLPAILMEEASPFLSETVLFICPSLLAGAGHAAQLYFPAALGWNAKSYSIFSGQSHHSF